MEIQNGIVFTEDRKFSQQPVYTEGERFSASPSGETLDARGLYVLPGLVDIHIHGYAGTDFCDGDPEGLRRMAERLACEGVTSFLGTTMSFGLKELAKAAEGFQQYEEHPSPAGAVLRGVHMEGPFLSKNKRGAQAEQYIIPPDFSFFQEACTLFSQKIRLVDIAPELPGAMDFIRRAREICPVSLAHTEADYDTALQALEAGADHITHMYNAMPPFLHRTPGVIGAAAEKADFCELIADGIHVHPSVVRSTFRWFGWEHICLISDCMQAGGLPSGEYILGGQKVFVRDRKATLEDGTIAGSAVSLGECLRRAIAFGVPREEAVLAATASPARSVGLYEEIGRISPGLQADILIADSSFRPVYVIIGGKIIYRRS